jgi:hypothetical protein
MSGPEESPVGNDEYSGQAMETSLPAPWDSALAVANTIRRQAGREHPLSKHAYGCTEVFLRRRSALLELEREKP